MRFNKLTEEQKKENVKILSILANCDYDTMYVTLKELNENRWNKDGTLDISRYSIRQQIDFEDVLNGLEKEIEPKL